ncbi:MAG: hypothetical protein EOP81_04745 [Variovorax sp.]|nr:MAG: hypothetical protein EOP81_04745 [Variovorax sp.]
MKNVFFWIFALAASLPTHAGVSVESGCYQQISEAVGKNTTFFFFQSYRDEELLEDVGAFVSYKNSNKRIALLFSDEIQGEGMNEGDYQKFWFEVINKKVAGQYVEYGNYNGNPGGKHIKYTSFTTNRVTTFRIATIASPCSAVTR